MLCKSDGLSAGTGGAEKENDQVTGRIVESLPKRKLGELWCLSWDAVLSTCLEREVSVEAAGTSTSRFGGTMPNSGAAAPDDLDQDSEEYGRV